MIDCKCPRIEYKIKIRQKGKRTKTVTRSIPECVRREDIEKEIKREIMDEIKIEVKRIWVTSA